MKLLSKDRVECWDSVLSCQRVCSEYIYASSERRWGKNTLCHQKTSLL